MSSTVSSQADAAPTRALAVLALASFASAANLRVCDPLLPLMAAELGVTVGAAALAVTAFAVAYGVFQVVVGPLADARGKLAMIVLGSVWAGAFTVLSAAMPGLGSLSAARFLAGAGAAAVIPVAFAWIGDVVPYERRQPVLARFLSGQILGVVFGQAVGGLLGELVGWRATMVLLGLAHIGAGLLLLGERRRVKVGVTVPVRIRWRAAATTAHGVLQQPWPRIVLVSVFLESVVMYGALAYIGADLHQRFGIGVGLVGAMLAAFGVGALAYALTAGRLLARFGQPGLAAAGAVLLAAGYTGLVVMPSVWFAPAAIAIIGLGFYMLHNTLQTNATQMAPEARGLAVSLFAFMLFLGQSIGITLAAPMIDRYGARPIYLFSAAALLAIAFWYRGQLLRHAP